MGFVGSCRQNAGFRPFRASAYLGWKSAEVTRGSRYLHAGGLLHGSQSTRALLASPLTGPAPAFPS